MAQLCLIRFRAERFIVPDRLAVVPQRGPMKLCGGLKPVPKICCDRVA
jgi:hypothetical protein